MTSTDFQILGLHAVAMVGALIFTAFLFCKIRQIKKDRRAGERLVMLANSAVCELMNEYGTVNFERWSTMTMYRSGSAESGMVDVIVTNFHRGGYVYVLGFSTKIPLKRLDEALGVIRDTLDRKVLCSL